MWIDKELHIHLRLELGLVLSSALSACSIFRYALAALWRQANGPVLQMRTAE